MTKQTAYLASIAVLALSAVFAQSAQAKFVITLSEVGPNVVEIGRGTIDLTDLGDPFEFFVSVPLIVPQFQIVAAGSKELVNDFSVSSILAPGPFGPGGDGDPSLATGDAVGSTGQDIFVPQSYQSGAPLSNSSFFADTTFSSLGAVPGTYVWSWGTGAHADTMTLQIGPSASEPAAPEPSTWAMMLIGFAGLGYAAARRARARRAVSA